MSKWSSIHGNGAISDAGSPVQIAYGLKGPVIRPSSGKKTGTVLFALPNPPAGATAAKILDIGMTSNYAFVSKVEILYGENGVYRDTTSTHKASFQSNLDGPTINVQADRQGKGIGVALTVTFEDDDSNLTVSSVGLAF